MNIFLKLLIISLAFLPVNKAFSQYKEIPTIIHDVEMLLIKLKHDQIMFSTEIERIKHSIYFEGRELLEILQSYRWIKWDNKNHITFPEKTEEGSVYLEQLKNELIKFSKLPSKKLSFIAQLLNPFNFGRSIWKASENFSMEIVESKNYLTEIIQSIDIRYSNKTYRRLENNINQIHLASLYLKNTDLPEYRSFLEQVEYLNVLIEKNYFERSPLDARKKSVLTKNNDDPYFLKAKYIDLDTLINDGINKLQKKFVLVENIMPLRKKYIEGLENALVTLKKITKDPLYEWHETFPVDYALSNSGKPRKVQQTSTNQKNTLPHVFETPSSHEDILNSFNLLNSLVLSEDGLGYERPKPQEEQCIPSEIPNSDLPDNCLTDSSFSSNDRDLNTTFDANDSTSGSLDSSL